MAELKVPYSDSKLDYNFQPKPQFDEDHDDEDQNQINSTHLDLQLSHHHHDHDAKTQPVEPVDSFDSDSDSDHVGFVGVTDFDRPPFCWDYLGFNNTINPTSSEFHPPIINHDDDDDDDDDDDVTTDSFFFFHSLDAEVSASPSTQLETVETETETETEREVSVLFDTYQERVEREVMIQSHSNNPDFDIDQAILNLEWQLLLGEIDNNNSNNIIYDFILQDLDSRINTPTSDYVINNLPTICLDVDVDVACAICKVDFSSGEDVRHLPCSHYYHRHCIFPWLRLHNTCPLCRFQLPSHRPHPA